MPWTKVSKYLIIFVALISSTSCQVNQQSPNSDEPSSIYAVDDFYKHQQADDVPLAARLNKNRLGTTSSFSIVFNQAMQPLSLSAIKYEASPAMACEWIWEDAKHLSCHLSPDDVIPATKYKMKITEGLISQMGEQLPALQLELETGRPNLRSIAVDWTGPQEPVLTLRFNQDIDFESLQGRLYVIDGMGQRTELKVIKPFEPAQNSKWQTQGKFKVAPVAKLKPNFDYHIGLRDGIKSEHGELTSLFAVVDHYGAKFRTHGRFEFLGVNCRANPCAAGEWAEIRFNTLLDKASIANCLPLQSEGKVAIRQDRTRNSFWMRLNEPKTRVDLSCLDEIKDEFGRQISSTKHFIDVGDFLPWYEVSAHNLVVPFDQFLDLQQASLNIENIEVMFSHVNHQEINGNTAGLNYRLDFGPITNQVKTTSLIPDSLRSAQQISGKVSAVDEDRFSQEFSLQRSKYNVLVQTLKNNLLVFVGDINSNLPVPELGFELQCESNDYWIKNDNTYEFRAKTDTQGVSVLTPPDEWHCDEFRFLFDDGTGATLNAGMAVGGRWNEPEIDYYDSALLNDPFFVGTSNKAVYKPGDTVKYTGYFKKWSQGKLIRAELPENAALSVPDTQSDCFRECPYIYLDKNPNVDEFGQVTGEFTLPLSAKDGRYVLMIDDEALNETYHSNFVFSVSNVKAQKLKLVVDSGQEGILTDSNLTINLLAEYYSGGPYKDALVELEYETQISDFGELWPQYSDYKFVIDERNTTNEQDGTLNVVLDGQGRNSLTLEYPVTNIRFGELVVYSSLETDEGEWVISNELTYPFATKPYFVGIKKLSWWLDSDQKVDLNAVVVDLQGNPVEDVDVEFFVQKQKPGGDRWRPEYSERQELKCETKSRQSCIAELALTQRIQLVAEITYADGTKQASVSRHYVSDPSGEPEKELFLHMEKPILKVGDTAELSLAHTFETASALVVVHRNKILDYWWQTLEPGANKIRFEIEEAHAGGVDVSVFVNYGNLAQLTNHTPSKFVQTARQTIYVPITVDKHLISVETDLATILPEQKLNLKINNLDIEDVKITLAIVDQSIVDQLGDYPPYDLSQTLAQIKYFRWSYEDFDNYALADKLKLAPQILSAPEFQDKLRYSEFEDRRKYWRASYDESHDVERIEVTGSRIKRTDLIASEPFIFESHRSDETSAKSRKLTGQGKGINHRTLFTDAAYWRDDIIIGGEQETSLQIQLPDNLTTWKVYAIATTKSGRLGDASVSVTTSKDVELHADVPAHLIKGDNLQYRAEAIVKAEDVSQIDLSVSAYLQTGEEQSAMAHEQFSMDIHSQFQRVNVTASIDADEEGELILISEARAGRYTDGLIQSTLVGNALMQRYASFYQVLPDELNKSLPIPAEASSDTANLSFTLSGSVLSYLQGSFDYMAGYEHQCWEQKLSRATVAAIELKHGVDSEDRTAKLNTHIRDAIDSLTLFQASNGGMAFFGSDVSSVSPMLSAYTYRNIHQLAEMGHEFSSLDKQKLDKYLAQYLSNHSGKVDGKRKQEVQLLALIMQALLHNSEHVALIEQQLTPLLSQAHSYNLTTLGLLLDIVADFPQFSKQKATLTELIWARTRSTNKKHILVEDIDIAWHYYHSGAQSYCRVIDGLIATGTEQSTVYKMLNGLFDQQRRSRGDFGNTISNGVCSLTVDQFIDEYEDAENTPEYSVQVQGKAIALNNEQPLANLPISLDAPIQTQISGRGNAFLHTRMAYGVDAETLSTTNSGLAIGREYFVYRGDMWVPMSRDNIARGDLVKVRLELLTSQLRRNLAVTDPLPGAFFALDENLGSRAPAELFEGLEQSYYFDERQMSRRDVRFYADILPPGRYVVEYLVQVNFAGEFRALPAVIEEMYDDDIRANTQITEIQVGIKSD